MICLGRSETKMLTVQHYFSMSYLQSPGSDSSIDTGVVSEGTQRGLQPRC